MNTKLLIGFIVLLAIVLVLPIVAQVVRSGGVSGTTASQGPPPSANEPPRLTESNLVGSGWSVKTPEIPIAVTIALNAGGHAVATIPPMFAPIARQQLGTDTITGNWSVQGSKLTASVNVKNQTHVIECDIRGDRIFYQGTEIRRVH